MNAQTVVHPTLRARLAALPGELLVRLALKLDAVVSGANGVVYLTLAGELADGLGVSEAVLRAVGGFFVIYAAALWVVATRERVNRTAVRVVIVGNLIWMVDSLIVLAAGWADPETIGAVWIALQALVVGGFAALQALALRRAD
jgi:hypothetical protein